MSHTSAILRHWNSVSEAPDASFSLTCHSPQPQPLAEHHFLSRPTQQKSIQSSFPSLYPRTHSKAALHRILQIASTRSSRGGQRSTSGFRALLPTVSVLPKASVSSKHINQTHLSNISHQLITIGEIFKEQYRQNNVNLLPPFSPFIRTQE